MNGTWKVTGGAGASAAAAVAIAVVVVQGVEWVIAYFFWILGAGVVVVALTAMAVVRLMQWSDARAVRVWAQRPAQLHAQPDAEVTRVERPSVEQHVHYHYHAADQPGRVRTVISGQAGDAISEGK